MSDTADAQRNQRPTPSNFRVAGVPVQVRAAFLVVTALLGWAPAHPERTALWLGITFVCILVHELGHAMVARAFGHKARIELHGLGGSTFHDGGPLTTAQECAVLFAGPLAGFVLGALVWPLRALDLSELARVAVDDALWITWGYGVLNLVPILPLDGGQMMRALLVHFMGERGKTAAAVVSVVVGVALIAVAIVMHSGRAAFLVGWLVLSRLRPLLDVMHAKADAKSVALKAFHEAAGAHDVDLVIKHGLLALPVVKASANRANVAHATAFALVQRGRHQEASDALARMPAGYTADALLRAQILVATEHAAEAVPLLQSRTDATSRRLLVQALSKTGQHNDAVATARPLAVDHPGKHTLETALFYAGQLEESLAVSLSIYADTPCPESAYNAACACARLGRADDGVQWLGRAIDAGYRERARIEADDDLAGLRAHPGYQAVLARIA